MSPVDPHAPPASLGGEEADADTIVEGQGDEPDHGDPNATLSPGTRLGRYVVLEEIGSGGMGMVFAAYDPELNRKVALKLLRPRSKERSRAQQSGRLLQEAQALAKLAHPNVITVYDVGTFGERVFVAMELVEGTTLRGWMREKKRRWSEVLSVFIPAGRGLAAAHAAELVHRDFKPENVLIGRDGRVRVMDFGLARPMRSETSESADIDANRDFGSEPASSESPADARDGESRSDAARDPADVADPMMTQTGSTLGTPAYMAPEQHLGKATDARSDQFSFCVSLYHALYGQRPFDGADATTLATQKATSLILDPPSGSGVPAWVRRHVWQGLSADPQQRFASMGDLLDALADDPSVKRRKVLAGVGATVAIVASVGGVQYMRSRGPSVCRDAPDRLAEVWTAERREEVGAAMQAHAATVGAQSWTAAADAVDAYGDSWTRMYTEACEATHVRGEQSERLLELRRSCLQERLDEIDAWASLLTEATPGVAARAPHAALGISRLSSCADAEALASAVDPPEGEPVRNAVAALRADLARVKVLAQLGQHDEALALAKVSYEAAATVDYPPVLAEARYRLGQAQGMRGDNEQAKENLEEAQWKGASVKHDAVAAAAASELVNLVGRRMGDYEDGLGWSRHAEAAIKRIGAHGYMEARLLHDVGVIRGASGDLQGAVGDLERALEIYASVPASDLLRIDATARLGSVRLTSGSTDEASALFEDARAQAVALLGEAHPDVAAIDALRGQVLDARGDHDAALALMQDALSRSQTAYGAKDPELVPLLDEIARSHRTHGEFDAAVEAKREIHALQRDRLGSHPLVARSLYDIATALEAAGHDDEARTSHEEALTIWEATRGDDHPDLAYALTSLGLLDVRGEESARAVTRLERALKLRGGRGLEPQLLARTQFALAQALHGTGGDHPRARELATKARDTFAKGRSPAPEQAAEVDRWLKKATAATASPPKP